MLYAADDMVLTHAKREAARAGPGQDLGRIGPGLAASLFVYIKTMLSAPDNMV